jgi:hypothetical protein
MAIMGQKNSEITQEIKETCSTGINFRWYHNPSTDNSRDKCRPPEIDEFWEQGGHIVAYGDNIG